MITSFFASIVEAWQELRVHKVRVLMSLIGVGVAVCALTLVVGFGDMMQKGLTTSYEEQGGRAATYTFNIYGADGGESTSEADAEKVATALKNTTERYGISYYSAWGQGEMTLTGPTGEQSTSVQVVDPQYNVLRKLEPETGRWFTESDKDNLSPPIVADELFLEQQGIDPEALPATVELPGQPKTTATIIGSVPSSAFSDVGMIYVLNEQTSKFGEAVSKASSYEMWFPPAVAKDLGKQVTADLKRQLPGYEIDGSRTDFAGQMEDALGPVQNVLIVISVLILFMGMLGLLNISMVTIQQRIREIGIRRSFGATSRRIFFSVMMESVVATTVAGAVGVLIAVLVLKAPFIGDLLFDGMSAPPQVPFSAVIVGMLVSIGVGALAGLIPAIVATQVKIIDAIRA